jgi:hypothetical protein
MAIRNNSTYTRNVLRAPCAGVATLDPGGSVSFTGSDAYTE